MSCGRDQAFGFTRWHPGWIALASGVALTFAGIVAIDTAETALAAKQKTWLFISFIAFGLCLVPDARTVGRFAHLFYAAILLLLAVIILPGVPDAIVPVRNGARSWINLYFMDMQPSELAKISVVLSLAWYLRYRDNYRSLRGLLVPFGLVLVPVMLILRQPDLGTAMLFAPTLFAMLVAAGAKLRHLAGVIALAGLFVVLNVLIVLAMPDSVQVLKPHQRARIEAMVSRAQGDRRFDQSINYQQLQAMTVLGSGAVTGYGAERSASIVEANQLPLDYNDMIFAVIVNRFGLCGGATLIGLFLVLVLSILAVASRIKDPFTRLACVGFAAIFFVQSCVNIGITLGLLPVTGITLPFVSYGGSSLVTTFAMLGLVINFALQRPLLLGWPSFEFDRADTLTDG